MYWEGDGKQLESEEALWMGKFINPRQVSYFAPEDLYWGVVRNISLVQPAPSLLPKLANVM